MDKNKVHLTQQRYMGLVSLVGFFGCGYFKFCEWVQVQNLIHSYRNQYLCVDALLRREGIDFISLNHINALSFEDVSL